MHPQLRRYISNYMQQFESPSVMLEHQLTTVFTARDPYRVENAIEVLKVAGIKPRAALYVRAIKNHALSGHPNAIERLIGDMKSLGYYVNIDVYWRLLVSYYALGDAVSLRAMFKRIVNEHAELVNTEFISGAVELVHRLTDEPLLAKSLIDHVQQSSINLTLDSSDLMHVYLPVLLGEANKGSIESVERIIRWIGPLPESHELYSIPCNLIVIAMARSGNVMEAWELWKQVRANAPEMQEQEDLDNDTAGEREVAVDGEDSTIDQEEEDEVDTGDDEEEIDEAEEEVDEDEIDEEEIDEDEIDESDDEQHEQDEMYDGSDENGMAAQSNDGGEEQDNALDILELSEDQGEPCNDDKQFEIVSALARRELLTSRPEPKTNLTTRTYLVLVEEMLASGNWLEALELFRPIKDDTSITKEACAAFQQSLSSPSTTLPGRLRGTFRKIIRMLRARRNT
jgi:hypothetical protein